MKIRLACGITLFALALPGLAAQADDIPLKRFDIWAQDYTGRKADPDVLFGTLPNGLRYAIQHNETPKDGVAMRLRIGSGSIQERDGEEGYAHFLEHMAFRGSSNVADGEVVRMLERQGLRLGPDTNAMTSQTQTVYQFNFPKADAGALETGLTLFREIGEMLTLAPAALDAERGVIGSEERARDVPAYRATQAQMGNALAGTRAVQRWPIGNMAAIAAATPARLRRYYEANYRPENATLIVIGNIDADKVEAAIKAGFADWKGKGAADKVDFGTPVPKQQAAEFIGPGVPYGLTLTWVRPDERRAEVFAVNREYLTRNVGMQVLNARLAERAAKAGSPYIAGLAMLVPSTMNSASLTQLVIIGAADKWSEGLAAVVEVQRQLFEGAISPAEFQRAVTGLNTLYEARAGSAATRASAGIANTLVSIVDEGRLYSSPAQERDLVKQVLASVRIEDVLPALKAAFQGAGPVIFRQGSANPAGEQALAAALTAAYARPLAARIAEADVVWPYTDFGAPDKVTSTRSDKDLGTTLVEFSNGSRLLVKPSALEKDRVYVNVALGNGRSGAPDSLMHALWAVDAMPMGGTGKLASDAIARWTQASGKVVGATLAAGARSFNLRGGTRPQDFTTQMQLLAAYARDPGFRPELGERLVALRPLIKTQLEAAAAPVFMREMTRLVFGGDARFTAPSPADIDATEVSDLSALLRGALAGPADVTVVGDITVDQAIAGVQTTFAAGTAASRAPAAQVHIRMAEGSKDPYVVTHAGRSDQAMYGVIWAMPDYFSDPQLSRTADVAAALLQGRLVDTVREKLGITYSPNVGAAAAADLPGQGYFNVAIETPPANFEAFRGLLDEQVKSLAATPAEADEFQRARKPLIEAVVRNRQSNTWWMSRLPELLRNPRVKSALLDEVQGLEAVTAADVQALFRGHLAGKVPSTVISRAK